LWRKRRQIHGPASRLFGPQHGLFILGKIDPSQFHLVKDPVFFG
jgi:hypothetical protein